jgi:hypothetical protein
MKAILSLFLIFLTFALSAQTVNDKAVKEISAEYIQIMGSQNMMGSKMNIDFDLGEAGKEIKIKDEAGKTIKFNSMMEAVNFFTKNGFEYVDSFGYSDGDVRRQYVVLKKK